MAFEHKALKSNWTAFRKNLDALNTALAKGNDIMPGVTTNVSGILGQVEGVVSDVEFMGNMLGNGSGNGSDESEKAVETPKPAPAVQQPPAPINAPPFPPAPPPTPVRVTVEPQDFDLSPGAVNRIEPSAPAVAQPVAPTFHTAAE